MDAVALGAEFVLLRELIFLKVELFLCAVLSILEVHEFLKSKLYLLFFVNELCHLVFGFYLF